MALNIYEKDLMKDVLWMLYFNWQNKRPLDLIIWTQDYQKERNFINQIMNNRGGTYILNNGYTDIKKFVEKYKV